MTKPKQQDAPPVEPKSGEAALLANDTAVAEIERTLREGADALIANNISRVLRDFELLEGDKAATGAVGPIAIEMNLKMGVSVDDGIADVDLSLSWQPKSAKRADSLPTHSINPNQPDLPAISPAE